MYVCNNDSGGGFSSGGNWRGNRRERRPIVLNAPVRKYASNYCEQSMTGDTSGRAFRRIAGISDAGKYF
jgi:hypothetical protein